MSEEAASGTDARNDLDHDLAKIALEHAWNWFSVHADHRLRAVNFFLIAVAFLVTAYVTALEKNPPLAIAVGVVGLFVTFAFNRLELRIRELVKAGEAAMGPFQGRLAGLTGVDQLRIVQRVEMSGRPFTKYSKVIGTLHWVAYVCFLGATLYAWYRLQRS